MAVSEQVANVNFDNGLEKLCLNKNDYFSW